MSTAARRSSSPKARFGSGKYLETGRFARCNSPRGETETLDKMKARIDFDLDYLRNWTLRLDLYIIVRTVWVVLRRQQAY